MLSFTASSAESKHLTRTLIRTMFQTNISTSGLRDFECLQSRIPKATSASGFQSRTHSSPKHDLGIPFTRQHYIPYGHTKLRQLRLLIIFSWLPRVCTLARPIRECHFRRRLCFPLFRPRYQSSPALCVDSSSPINL